MEFEWWNNLVGAVISILIYAVVGFVTGQPLYTLQGFLLLVIALFIVFGAIWFLERKYGTKSPAARKNNAPRKDSFEAALTDGKTTYRLGEQVSCHVKFSGYVENGIFDAYIKLPDNRTCYRWDTSTYLLEEAGPTSPGSLYGEYKDREGDWSFQLKWREGDPGGEWPPGRYVVELCLIDHHTTGGFWMFVGYEITHVLLRRYRSLFPVEKLRRRDKIGAQPFAITVLPSGTP